MTPGLSVVLRCCRIKDIAEGQENPWTEEPGRLQSMELLRVGHD